MNIYLLIAEIAVLSILVFCCTYFSNLLFKNRKKLVFSLKGPKTWRQVLVYILIPLTLAGVGFMLNYYYKDHQDVYFITRRLCVIAILWPAAVFDHREFRIPNGILLIGLILWAVILLPEMILAWDNVPGELLSGAIAAAGILVIGFLFLLLAKGSLGMGDLKLLALMGLFLGIEGLIYSLLYSLLIAFFAAVFLLITKKKKKKDHIPFAPYILLGTIACFILSGV